MRVPSVEARVEVLHGYGPEAYAVRTTSGEVVTIDPWAGSVQTIAEDASFWEPTGETFWLVEGGSLVVRDRKGNLLQTAGEGITEVAVSLDGKEAAYVDAKGLWVLKPGDPGPIAVPTTAAPCKPAYAIGESPQRLTYRDDCAAGVLGVLERATGETRVFSIGVTSVLAFRGISRSWLFFEREEPGKKRELWAVPDAGEPVFVGTNPRPRWWIWPNKEDVMLDLDYDGATSTLGKWSPEGGFSPVLEGFGERSAVMMGYAQASGQPIRASSAYRRPFLDSPLPSRDGLPRGRWLSFDGVPAVLGDPVEHPLGRQLGGRLQGESCPRLGGADPLQEYGDNMWGEWDRPDPQRT